MLHSKLSASKLEARPHFCLAVCICVLPFVQLSGGCFNPGAKNSRGSVLSQVGSGVVGRAFAPAHSVSYVDSACPGGFDAIKTIGGTPNMHPTYTSPWDSSVSYKLIGGPSAVKDGVLGGFALRCVSRDASCNSVYLARLSRLSYCMGPWPIQRGVRFLTLYAV